MQAQIYVRGWVRAHTGALPLAHTVHVNIPTLDVGAWPPRSAFRGVPAAPWFLRPCDCLEDRQNTP